MEAVVIVIMLLVGFSFMLKLTYMPFYSRLAVGVACAVFIVLSLGIAVNQSKTQISDWLQNPEFMLDMAVLLTVDVFMQLTFCIMAARRISVRRQSRSENLVRQALLWIPGVLIIAVLLVLLVETLFCFPGVDFNTLAWLLAGVMLIIGVVLPLLLKWLIPEKDLRLELIFMINILIAVLGVVATVNGRTAVAGASEVEWKPLIGVIIMLLTGACTGFILFRRKINKQILNII